MPTWVLFYLESIAAAEVPLPLAILAIAIMCAGAAPILAQSLRGGPSSR